MFAMRTKDPNQRLVRVFQSKEAMFAIVTEEESVFFSRNFIQSNDYSMEKTKLDIKYKDAKNRSRC